jgi:hypothetical protein
MKINMNAKNAIKNFLFFGSLYYTAITAVILFIAITLSHTDTVKVVEANNFFKIMLFSFTMALGSAIFRIDTLPRVWARTIHAACYIIGFLIFVALCGANFALSAISTAVFGLLYVITALIVGSVKRKLPKSK